MKFFRNIISSTSFPLHITLFVTNVCEKDLFILIIVPYNM